MRIAVFGTKPYDRSFLEAANLRFGHELVFFESRLTPETVTIAAGFPAICAFVNDVLDRHVLDALARGGTRLVALRCAGFNHVDLGSAERLGIQVVRVPAYSPHAVAEHTVALILSLARKIHRAHSRVREGNFSLVGLLGFELCGRTAGVVGTGQIGAVVARILAGFGCRLLGYDPAPSEECLALGMRYDTLPRILEESDIITLHCPLTPSTRYLIDQAAVARMRTGVMLINTSRGPVIQTAAVIEGLKNGKIGALGLDVYEEEADYFFEDRSAEVISDDTLARLLTFPNVLITGHQAFFTEEALHSIAETTLGNVREIEETGTCRNCLAAPASKPS